MNDTQLLTRLAEANAYGKETPLPATIWTSDLALREIERRMGMDTHESTSKQKTTGATEQLQSSGAADVVAKQTPRNRRSAALVAAANFVLVIVVGVGIALMNGEDEPQPFGAESSMAVADDYFAAFNAGDSEAVMALFTPDATFAFQSVGDRTAEPTLRTFWEERLVWNTAQGTIMTTHDCAVTDEAPGAVTVECDHGTHDAPAQAVDAVAVPTTTTMKITPTTIHNSAGTQAGVSGRQTAASSGRNTFSATCAGFLMFSMASMSDSQLSWRSRSSTRSCSMRSA